MRSSAVVAVGTALSRVTGFVRIAALAYALGVTALAGTYSYANETPNIVYELLLGGVFTATLVPLFVKYFESDDEDAVSAVATVSMLALLAVTVLGILLAPLIVRLYTLDVHGPGPREPAGAGDRAAPAVHAADAVLRHHRARDRDAQRAAPVRRRRVRADPQQRRRDRGVPHAARASRASRCRCTPSSTTTLLVLLMGVGTTAGVAVMALALLPALRRARVRLRFLPAWRHAAVRTMVRVGGWTVGYVIANQVALFVVTVLAVGTKGGPFVYMAAYTFFQLPHGLFAVSLMTTFAPELASAGARGDIPAMRAQLSRALRLTTVVIVPAAALYIALARPLIVDAAPTRRVLRRRRVDRGRHARRVRGRAVAVLDLPVLVARVHVAPRHVHAVLDQLHRERGQHRARLRPLRVARRARARARVLARLLLRRDRVARRRRPPAPRHRGPRARDHHR